MNCFAAEELPIIPLLSCSNLSILLTYVLSSSFTWDVTIHLLDYDRKSYGFNLVRKQSNSVCPPDDNQHYFPVWLKKYGMSILLFWIYFKILKHFVEKEKKISKLIRLPLEKDYNGKLHGKLHLPELFSRLDELIFFQINIAKFFFCNIKIKI